MEEKLIINTGKAFSVVDKKRLKKIFLLKKLVLSLYHKTKKQF